MVNKSELLKYVAGRAEVSQVVASRVLDAMIDAVTSSMQKGDSVALVGFGTFATGKRAARTGRNPRTGDTIKIPAAVIPKFRPGKTLRDALNS
ncbi:DNA-binding protein HU-beta [Candidatus Symbiobacter mobilis CR]|uniref:DNA-binding protein HU-beta n=1 Tax=Candidatus Symbiobacter mobilis CR TaxID=946483 RepID=U5NBG0_9BURK|nr:DNA-binding protein HU-beta [Candidatus Symbiobacter mobilis CR]